MRTELGCSRTPPTETKVCPVCDAAIDADAQTCPSCLTDLSLFDLSGDASSDSVDVRLAEGKNIDDILASIMDGKAEHPEIFETLKSVASEHRSTKDLVVEAKPVPAPVPTVAEEAAQQFLCPVCDTVVNPDDKVCPGCGAEFSEGESTEYECPVCKASVPAEADQCPSCGVRFATEDGSVPEAGPAVKPEAPVSGATAKTPFPSITPTSATALPATPMKMPEVPRMALAPRITALREERRSEQRELPYGDRKLIARELPKLVNDVKPLLVSAKRLGLEISEGKRLINAAIEAGKRKEMEKAVKLIVDAQRSLDVAFVDFIGGRMESVAAEVEAAGSGDAASLVRPKLEDAFVRLQNRDYDRAWETLQTAKHGFQSQTKEYSEGRKILEATDRLMGEVRALGMDTKDVDQLVRQSRGAGERHDLPESLRLAKQAQEQLLRAIPVFVQDKMRIARDGLLDRKMRGGDTTKLVGILKEASNHVKNEEWSEALRFLKEFNKELGRAGKA